MQNIDGVPDGTAKSFALGANYTTTVVGNYSVRWIEKVVGEGRPFFANIHPKAAHEPFQPAPWYADHWHPSWPATAPRPPSWNVTAAQLANHHPNVASQAVLTQQVADCIDKAFADRWRTLMSVDDVVGAVYAKTKALGVHANTFYIYSSDHGFQLGELNLPQDKRNVCAFLTLPPPPPHPPSSPPPPPGTPCACCVRPALTFAGGVDLVRARACAAQTSSTSRSTW